MIEDLLIVPEDAETIEVINELIILFMYDNMPCSKTQDMADLLNKQYIPVMVQPANSPDLNPVKTLWCELKNWFYLKWKELYTSPLASKASVEMYKTMIAECWAETDWDYIRTLMESMHQ